MKLPNNLANKKIAIVTDWLTNLGGAEKVVACIANLFPDAPIYTTFVNHDKVKELFPNKSRIKPSIFSSIPLLANRQVTIAPFLKTAISMMNLKDYDVILSFSSSVAKNIKVLPHQTHICYIHTPPRYIWQKSDDNRFEKFPKFMQPFINIYLNRLKKWDLKHLDSVDLFISNSSETAKRVTKFYNRDSQVLYPPVDWNEFAIAAPNNKKDYFIGFGRFVKYKRFDLLIEAFLKMPDKNLVLVGEGPEFVSCQQKANNAPNIEFKGRLAFADLKNEIAQSRAMLLPQKEDAGITQLESFASGVPVIAFKSGGVLDVMQENVNGIFFDEQTPDSLIQAIEKFVKQEKDFDPKKIRQSAEPFSRQNFEKNYLNIVETFIKNKFSN